MIPDNAIAAGLAAWGQYPVGVSPKRQMTNILEAAAPYMAALSAEDIEAVADMIKAAKANGWDEGHEAGWADRRAERVTDNPYRLSADWRRIPLRQCPECPKLVPSAQERCKCHE